LNIAATIGEGISIGIKNIIPVVVNALLWVLTVWIPYLNIGTTIGLYVGIIAKAGNGERISMTEIFNPKYRKYLGEYFLTCALIGMGIFAGLLMFIFPGIIIAITWSLALLLVVDKGKDPTAAMTMSNNCTYGNKGRMFCIYLLFFLVYAVVILIAALIIWKVPRIYLFGMVLTFAGTIFMIFTIFGIQASVYKQLTTGNMAEPPVHAAAADTAKPDAPASKEQGKFCGACGTKNPSGKKFCGSCGKALT